MKVESQLKVQSDKIQKRLNQRRSIKNGMFGTSVLEPSLIEDESLSNRKKLSKTLVVPSSNEENESMSKFFINGAIITHEN